MVVVSHASNDYFNIKPTGALIYSILICKYFIPKIKTDRNWITINTGRCYDHSIVFAHSNIDFEQRYKFLEGKKDLIIVCSQKSTMYKLRKYGHTIYLPLSVDVNYIKGFTAPKTKEICYAGREDKIYSEQFKNNENVDYICNRTHSDMLRELAKYKKVYAVGITAIEARILGCEILPYDERYPDVNLWQIHDCKEMIPILQQKLDRIESRIKKC